ncbi:sensor histidine kinase [Methanocalculus chunghsingensis]|uniref:sensor histidine kinase n=1 Tax=Methanocalculus chunghsingensis TaxID=156457 RepID=UPI001B8D67C7|nr:HAMP domain-containing sensor histidine kinase [Methanocalculus chunghsingensis]
MQNSTTSWRPLAAIISTTFISLAVSLASLSSGFYIIFQNLFYIPIIIACVFYIRRGFLFSIILSFTYLGMLLLYAGYDHLLNGLVRVLIFITVAAVITLLAEISWKTEEKLKRNYEELAFTEEELRSQLEELIIAQNALKEEIERKSDFVMVAAHELRTPLQPALGYLTLLTSDPGGFGLTDEVLEILSNCEKNIQKERRIVDRMLDLSVADSGKLTPSSEDIALYQMIEEIITLSGYRRDAVIRDEIPPSAIVQGDQILLSYVFNDIIQNAVRYNDPPREVSIRYAPDGGYHQITIKDNGTGIDPSLRPRIFEPFSIADRQHLTREYNRMGLGLPLALRYVQLHGGDIIVESTLGRGSSFTILLPHEEKK